MFENIMKFFKKFNKNEEVQTSSRNTAKERLHLVLMQDRANVSVDFLELMKQEIIDVIKKYIDVDENAIDVRLTNKENNDGTNGAPALYANIPILNIKNEARKVDIEDKEDTKQEIKNQKDNKEIEVEKEDIIEEKEAEEKNIQEDVDVIIDETSLEKEETDNKKDKENKEEVDNKNDEENKEEKLKQEEKTDKSKEKVKSEN